MTTIKQMTDYLSVLTELEGQAYSCRLLVNRLNKKINILKSKHFYTNDDYIEDKIKNEVYHKNNSGLSNGFKRIIKKTSIVCLIIIVAIIAMAIIFKDISLIKEMNLHLYFISFALWAIIIYAIAAYKKKTAKKEAENNEIIIKNELEKSTILRENNEYLIADYSRQLNDAKSSLQTITSYLNEAYRENILPQKYRNLIAVSTMYQWLRDGRCTEIYGHGGLFDTYEYDLRLGQIVGQLTELNEKMDMIIQNQGLLYNEIKRGNEIAEMTYNSICKIENNSEIMKRDIRQIRTNTNLIAMNTAMQTSYQRYNYYRSLYY